MGTFNAEVDLCRDGCEQVYLRIPEKASRAGAMVRDGEYKSLDVTLNAVEIH